MVIWWLRKGQMVPLSWGRGDVVFSALGRLFRRTGE